jgi:hypothetical protein
MRVIASAEAMAFVRARGGRLFVWVVPMRYGPDPRRVFSLEAATQDPGGHTFVRFRHDDVELLLDAGDEGAPEELHVALVGRVRRRIRAYWNGTSFTRA